MGEGQAGTEGRRPGSLGGGEGGIAALHAAVATVLGILWALIKLAEEMCSGVSEEALEPQED